MPGYADAVELNNVTGLVVGVPHKCTLMAARGQNLTAADAYLQIFDAATIAEVTLGTTVARWWVLADPNDPSVGDGLPSNGLVFQNGIVVASTTTAVGSTTAAQHVRLGIQ